MHYPVSNLLSIYILLNGVMIIVEFVSLCLLLHKWWRYIWIHRYYLKFALAIFKHYWVKRYRILMLFADISMYHICVSATCVRSGTNLTMATLFGKV